MTEQTPKTKGMLIALNGRSAITPNSKVPESDQGGERERESARQAGKARQGRNLIIATI